MAKSSAMSLFSKNTTLSREWAANHTVKHKIIIEVVNFEVVNKWIKSPSFAADISDPVSLEGKVIRGDFFGESDIIKLVLPKLESGDVSKGEKLSLGLIDNDTVVCVGILPLNLGDTEENAWLKQWDCKKRS